MSAAQQGLPNIWHLRTVAETSSKSCYVCYKPSTSVLITPDNKDFFYICKSHLTDSGFASAIVDEKAEAEKRKKEQMNQEIEKIKKEYEEKMQQKKAKKKSKDDDKAKQDTNDDASKAEKERDEKVSTWSGAKGHRSYVLTTKYIEALQTGSADAPGNDGPRIFALHRNFYQMRLDRLRNIETARRNQQRIKDPAFFPATPNGDLT